MVAVLVVVATVDTEARAEAVLVQAQVGTVVGLEELAAAAGQGRARCQRAASSTNHVLQGPCCRKKDRSTLPDTHMEPHRLLQYRCHFCTHQVPYSLLHFPSGIFSSKKSPIQAGRYLFVLQTPLPK